MTKQATPLATIQIDTEGTQLGKFNDDGDPIISYQRPTDGWLLAYRIPTGTSVIGLDGVHGADQNAITEAVTAARKHLAAN